MNTLPVVTFVGKSNSGKTTFLEKVVAVLSARGIKLATVKHHPHESASDTENTDSWRHARAGAVVSMVSGPTQFAQFRAVDREVTLDEMAHQAATLGCDLLIAEGYKREPYPKIELSRTERSDEALFAPDELEALVTNNEMLAQAYRPHLPVFGLEDIDAFCDFFINHFLERTTDDH